MISNYLYNSLGRFLNYYQLNNTVCPLFPKDMLFCGCSLNELSYNVMNRPPVLKRALHWSYIWNSTVDVGAVIMADFRNSRLPLGHSALPASQALHTSQEQGWCHGCVGSEQKGPLWPIKGYILVVLYCVQPFDVMMHEFSPGTVLCRP